MFELPDGPVSLYLHIPLCKSRCSYCDFYSEPRHIWRGREERYFDRLLFEVTSLRVPAGGFHTLYIGGGDPVNLGPGSLKALIEAVHRWGRPMETTIEANPESVDERLFDLFEAGLVTRLSLGIQTMDEPTLGALGRRATAQVNRQALQFAQEARRRWGIDISVDLMVALPGQSIEMAMADIDEVLAAVDAEHLSLYCLSVEEGTRLAEQVASGQVTVFDEDGQEQFLRAIWRALAERGFEHYEVSNFAKARRYSQHNSVYWRLDDYLGLGSSAASTLAPVHWQQTQDFEQWIQGPALSGYELEKTTKVERIEEYLMMGLRTRWGVDKGRFGSRFALSFDQLFGGPVANFEPNWYRDTEQFFSLTEDGWMVLDEILVRLVGEIPESLDPT